MQECGKEQAKVAEERKRYREFTVTPGLCGFKVRIGCTEVYFSTAQKLGGAITDYLLDPQKTERQFQDGDIRIGGMPLNVPPPRIQPYAQERAALNSLMDADCPGEMR